MRISHRWLRELLPGLELGPEEVAERLTSLGLEVEEIHAFVPPEKVVVAEVRGKAPHPSRDKLTVVRVFDGVEEIEVVCGASNVPAPGGKVLFARVGARLPAGAGEVLEIGERSLGGVLSRGMICAEDELGLGDDHEGIFVFPAQADVAPGTSLADALPVLDHALEISLTPNRPDCLGHLGVARDLAASLSLPFSPPRPKARAVATDVLGTDAGGHLRLEWDGGEGGQADALDLSSFHVSLPDPVRCPRYGAAFVLGVQDGPSPFWLRHRLHVLGHRSISALVDATNLVMLESGHPIHGFDLERLRGGRIEVRLAREGETMKTLDDVARTFTSDDLLICDGEGPVAVAGVMGGLESEMRGSTRHVVIECAYFDPRSVRRTSRRLGLHTDASHRFERGVDPNDVPWVLARAATLMAEVGGGVAVREAIDVYPVPVERRRVDLGRARLNLLLGYEVPREVPARVLGALGCDVVEETDAALSVLAPTWRPDLAREADLIEEVGRVHGYDHIPTTVPAVRPAKAGTAPRIRFERALRITAASVGLHEAISYGFVASEDVGKLGAGAALSDLVRVQNPLGGRDAMRPTLLLGLASAASAALRHQATSAALFELGRVFRARVADRHAGWGETFHSDDAEDLALPREQSALALLLVGARPGWVGEAGHYDFYDAKGRVEAMVHALTGHHPDVEARATLDADAPYLHPKRRAAVTLGGHALGWIGELHPEVATKLELDGRRPVYAELDVAALFAASLALPAPKAAEPPRIPAVTRDVALLVDESLDAGELASTLRDATEGLAEEVSLFDVYTDAKHLPPGKKSLAFRIRYRDPSATLTDKRVDSAHGRAIAAAERQHGATAR